ncbi:hypothetical protein BSTP3_269 [Bacillus phage BSTP3]|nr:hypothetical protein BSTP3_269 [Bacillus phage BSTP3]
MKKSKNQSIDLILFNPPPLQKMEQVAITFMWRCGSTDPPEELPLW